LAPEPTAIFFLKSIAVPYGYQNGHFNLIKPICFDVMRADRAVKCASLYAIEGEYIAKNPHPEFGQSRLLVVGQFSPEQQDVKEKISTILQSFRVPGEGA